MKKFFYKLLNRTCRLLKNEKGFTLIEAIATIAVFGIVVTPIAVVFQYSLTSSIETRTSLKANQLTQQYVEAIEVMEFESLKSLVDDYGGVVDTTSISGLELSYSSSLNLPEPEDGFDVVVDLHYAEDRTDGSPDLEYNNGDASHDGTGSFDSSKYLMDPGIIVYAMPNYDMLLYLDSAKTNKVETFTQASPYNDGSGTPSDTFPDTGGDRLLSVQYEYTASGSIKVTTQVTGGGTSDHVDISPVDIYNNVIVVCDDEVSSSPYKITHIEVTNYTSETVNLLVFEPINDRITPTVITGLGTVNIERGLSEIDISSNTHRIYEVEVIVSKDGQELTHVTTTILAR